MAQIGQPKFAATTEISATGVKHRAETGNFTDDDALRLVVQTVGYAEGHANYRDFYQGWAGALRMYQSQTAVANWGGGQARSNFPFYLLSNSVNAFVPQVMDGIFAEDPPFLLKNRPGTSWETAQAVQNVVAYQLEEIDFRDELEAFVRNMGLFGTGVAKWGWEERTETRNRLKLVKTGVVKQDGFGQDVQFENDDEPDYLEDEDYEYLVARPRFENVVNLKQLIVDPTLDHPRITDAKFVAHRLYMTWDEIEALRDQPGYDIPSKDTVISWFLPPDPEQTEEAPQEQYPISPSLGLQADPRWTQASADMLSKPLEVLEYWTKDDLIVVLQKKLVIRNAKNPYGVIPFLSCNLVNVPGAFWGMGMGQMVGSEQRLQQGIVNIWLDQVALALFGSYIREKGANNSTQNMIAGPGVVLSVDNIDKFKVMERPPPVPEAGLHLQLSQGRVEQLTGSSLATQGIAGSTGHSNTTRTAAGINLIGSASQNAISAYLDRLAGSVFVPFLNAVMDLDRLMPQKVWTRILDEVHDKDDPEFEDLVNADVKFSVKAGSKLRERLAMAQAWPLIAQNLLQQPVINLLGVQKKKINAARLEKMAFIMAGWPNFDSIVEDMTPEDNQRWQMMQPGAAAMMKMKSQQDLQNLKDANKQKQIDQQGEIRFAADALKHSHQGEQNQAKMEHDANQQNLDRAAGEVQRADFRAAAGSESLTGQPNLNGPGFGGANF